MSGILEPMISYAFVLGVLVFFHELGHYAAARARGVTVEVFSIGFGPALLRWRAKSGTIWQLSALPLGGYVKMQGWGAPEDEAAAPPGSFSALSLASKAFVVAAGPAANMVLAFVLFAGLFSVVGQPVFKDNQPVVRPILSEVLANTPAQAAGLQSGDEVLAAGGTPISDFEQMRTIIAAHPDAVLPFTIRRAGTQMTLDVKLGHTGTVAEPLGFLGAQGQAMLMRHVGPIAAIQAGAVETWHDMVAVVMGLYRLVVVHEGVHDLAGPIGIAKISGQVAQTGFTNLLGLIALLSINLGIINLVPVPMLDGGHLMFYAAEAIIRRPVPARAREIGLRFGLALVVALIFLTTTNDLTR